MTYYADKEGKVFNEHGKEMKCWINPSGYYYFKMYYDGAAHASAVHRFVYEYFNEPIPPKMTIDHINNDKLDNRLENLRLTTNAFNCRRREYNKLNMELAEEIRDLYSQKLYSYSQLAAMFGVAKTTISNCIKGKTWNKI